MKLSSPAIAADRTGLLDRASDRRTPQTSRLASLWALYVLTLRQHLHGKRWMVMGALFLLTAGLVGVVRATSPDVSAPRAGICLRVSADSPGDSAAVGARVRFGNCKRRAGRADDHLPLDAPDPQVGLVLRQAFGDVVDHGRPGRGTHGADLRSNLRGRRIGGREIAWRCLQAASIHAVAVVAYCCLFGLLSLVTKQALTAGILYAVFFEGLLANMPFSLHLATVIYYTRLIAYRSMDFVVTMPGRAIKENPAAEFWRLDVRKDPGLLEHPQIRACLTVLLTASLVCTVVAACLCSQREFYVKTPEKS